jgi:hypothetical protein
MFWNDLRKVRNKVNERIVKSKVSFAIRIVNRIHKRAVLASICILLVVILGTIISGIAVAYAGSINGVGVEIYWDQGCTKRTHSLDWGIIKPGANSTVTVYVRNEGNSAVYLLMETSNWKPSVSLSYMTLIWTYSGTILNVDEVVPIDLILNVSPTVSGITDFSFDITIITTG